MAQFFSCVLNKHTRNGLLTFVIVFVVCAMFIPLASSAQLTVEETGINEVAASGLGGGNLTLMIARILRAFFGLLGITAVGYFVYGGVLWMTAGGKEDQVEKSKQTMINATIGMAIILSAFSIVSFIINALLKGTMGFGDNGGASGPGTPPGFAGGGALGQSIEYVIPEPGAKDVYRDTAIVVQFKQKLIPSSIFEQVDESKPQAITGTLDTSTILVYKTDLGESSALTADMLQGILSTTSVEIGGVQKEQSLLTLVLTNKGLLGSPTDDTSYSVKLGPKIQRYNDAGSAVPLFPSITGYDWQFTVGTEVDLYPPHITSIYPAISSTNNYRNVTVMINFDKPMMPSQILGGQYLTVLNHASSTPIVGVWSISNLAKTAEFHTNVECGKSACGDTYYCFDPNITVQMQATPGTVDVDRGTPKAIIPFDGLVSLTSNSFDGDGDGEADGPALFGADGVMTDMKDTKQWQFGVGSALDITGPYIEVIAPDKQASNVDKSAPLQARFSEALRPSSMTFVALNQPKDLAQWFYPQSFALDGAGQPIVLPDAAIEKMSIALSHAPFLESTETVVYSYMPSFTHGIKDAQNNCYLPAGGPGCKYSPSEFTNPYCCDGVKEPDGVACATKYQGYQQ